MQFASTPALVLVLSTACAPSGHGPRLEERPAGSVTESNPPGSVSVEASPSATASSRAEVPEPTAALVVPAGALFAYREDGISLAFTPPRQVTLLGRADRPCSYELGDNGNMYSGAEVEAAWRNKEAASAVAQSSAFMPPADLMIGAEARGAQGRIAWTPFCGGLCVSGPPGVVQLLRVLHVLATNARGVCGVTR